MFGTQNDVQKIIKQNENKQNPLLIQIIRLYFSNTTIVNVKTSTLEIV